MGVEQRSSPSKQRPIGCGYAVAAVFTGDEEGVDRRDLSPLELGQPAKHLSRAFAPFAAECGEIGVPVVEAAPLRHFEAVTFVANQVDRHAHRDRKSTRLNSSHLGISYSV